MPELNPDQFGTLYHGTAAEFSAGDTIHPGGRAGYQTFNPPHMAYSPEHVYMTTSRSQAEGFADAASRRRGGTSRIYEVRPEGDFEKDPETAGVKGWDVSYRSPSAQVVREVPYGERDR